MKSLERAIMEGLERWKAAHKERHPLLDYYPHNQLVHTARGVLCAGDAYLQPCPFGIFNIFAWSWGGVLTTSRWEFAFAKMGEFWHCCAYIQTACGKLFPFHLNSGKAFVPHAWGGVVTTVEVS
jgi:hypothetical protein